MTRFVLALALVLVVGTGRFRAAPDLLPRWARPVPSSDAAAVREPANWAASKPTDIRSGFVSRSIERLSMPVIVAQGRM